MYWRVPQDLWAGRTVAILASGPSMSAAVADAVRAARIPVIAINSTYQLAPWADMIYAADQAWWIQYHAQLSDFAGLKVSIEQTPGVLPPNMPEGVLVLRNSGNHGFDKDPGRLRTGGNSGYQALHVAAHAGARRVLLCGYEMGGGGHWHGDHPSPLTNSRTLLPRLRPRFAALASELRDARVEVVNCTPDSQLTVFPRVSLSLALAAEFLP